MIRVAFVLLLSTSIFVSCNDNTQLKKENNQLKAENEKLKSLVDSLTNTPQSMYSSAINSFQKDDFESSIKTLEIIQNNYPTWEKSLIKGKLTEVKLKQKHIKEEKEKLEVALNKYIKHKYDDFQKITWYETKRNTSRSIGNYRSLSVELYFGEKVDKTKFFRIRSRYVDKRSDYHDTQWIFYESVTLLGDNGYDITISTVYPNKQSENDSYALQEWSDDTISEDAVFKLAESKSISVRFNGKYTYDIKMNSNQLNAFKEIVEKYKRI